MTEAIVQTDSYKDKWWVNGGDWFIDHADEAAAVSGVVGAAALTVVYPPAGLVVLAACGNDYYLQDTPEGRDEDGSAANLPDIPHPNDPGFIAPDLPEPPSGSENPPPGIPFGLTFEQCVEGIGGLAPANVSGNDGGDEQLEQEYAYFTTLCQGNTECADALSQFKATLIEEIQNHFAITPETLLDLTDGHLTTSAAYFYSYCHDDNDDTVMPYWNGWCDRDDVNDVWGHHLEASHGAAIFVLGNQTPELETVFSDYITDTTVNNSMSQGEILSREAEAPPFYVSIQTAAIPVSTEQITEPNLRCQAFVFKKEPESTSGGHAIFESALLFMVDFGSESGLSEDERVMGIDLRSRLISQNPDNPIGMESLSIDLIDPFHGDSVGVYEINPSTAESFDPLTFSETQDMIEDSADHLIGVWEYLDNGIFLYDEQE